MSKNEADSCKKIEIWWLLRDMKDKNYKNTTITWGEGGSGGSVSVQVFLFSDDKYVRFIYTQTDRYTEEKKDFDYKIPLIETPCHFGGTRYWFKCHLHKRNIYCGRRVGVVYKDGDWFGCRHCYELTYSSRKLSGIAKSFGKLASLQEVEKLMKAVKRTHYRGKPTRKYQRYLNTEDKSETGYMGMIMLLNDRFSHTKTKFKDAKKLKK